MHAQARALGLGTLLLLASGGASAATAHVATASNFLATLRELAADFEARNPHRIKISSGSTGKLYAQIRHGAPYDLFLAADTRRPRLLEEQGRVAADGRFTYAVGRLVLWDPNARGPLDGPARLRQERYRFLAIANPDTAPYGLAARQTLQSLTLWEDPEGHMVRGENIGQAYQYVASGNAELGFVALSQVESPRHSGEGAYWLVPTERHAPIRQQAAVLAGREEGPAVAEFVDYLRSQPAQRIIESYGYAVP